MTTMRVTIRHTELEDVEVSALVGVPGEWRKSDLVAAVLNRLFLAMPGLAGPKVATETWEVVG